MLIEVRSSNADPNNTPNHMIQRFKETLILKPNSKIALVSALTTTFKADAYIIDNDNNTLDVKIAKLPPRTVTLTQGNYTGAQLATEIQTKIRDLGVKQDHKALFYPDTGMLVTKNSDGFHLQIAYEPIGFTSPVIDPINPTTKNTGITISNVGILLGAEFTPERPIYRNRGSNASGLSFSSGVIASNPILPYAQVGANKNYTGMATIGTFVKSNRPLNFGLQLNNGIKDIKNLMLDAIDQYTSSGLGPVVIQYWDKFTQADIPTGQPRYDFKYIVTTLPTGLPATKQYVKQDDVYYNQYSVHNNYENPATNPGNALIVSFNTDTTAGTGYSYAGSDYTPSGQSIGDLIPIAGEGDYR